MGVEQRVSESMGVEVRSMRPLSGGCVADVRRAELADGRSVVVKAGPAGAKLDVEGFMLHYLREHSDLPVPRVFHSEDTLLVIEFIESGGGLGPSCERHAAELLAALHAIDAEQYGFERDTLIGPLDQPNPPGEDWGTFFAEHRLLHMARLARDAGRLDAGAVARIERLAERTPELIGAGDSPSLIHGDVWSGNVLARGGRIASFLDPAIYFADAEVELAFIALFGTFGEAFFERYDELRPIRPGFFETRRDLYNLYPLLVHTRLFGGQYGQSVLRIVRSLGF